MTFFKKIGQNISKNLKPIKGKPDIYEKTGWVLLGAATNKLVGTIAQGWFGFNMSGARGATISTAISTFFSLAIDKPLMAAGSVGEYGIHLLYVYGNDVVASVFGSPIPAMDPNALTLKDTVPDGYEVLPVGGQNVLVNSKTAKESLSGYGNNVPDQTMQGYGTTVPDQTLLGYGNTVPDQTLLGYGNNVMEQTLNDGGLDFDSVVDAIN